VQTIVVIVEHPPEVKLALREALLLHAKNEDPGLSRLDEVMDLAINVATLKPLPVPASLDFGGYTLKVERVQLDEPQSEMQVIEE